VEQHEPAWDPVVETKDPVAPWPKLIDSVFNIVHHTGLKKGETYFTQLSNYRINDSKYLPVTAPSDQFFEFFVWTRAVSGLVGKDFIHRL
jgi:hypothetical protein